MYTYSYTQFHMYKKENSFIYHNEVIVDKWIK